MASPRYGRYLLVTITLLCMVYWLHKFGSQSAKSQATAQTVAAEQQGQSLTHEEDTTVAGFDTLRAHQEEALQVQSSVIEHKSSSLLPVGYTAAFPRHIWQTSSEAGKSKYADQIQTWKHVKGFEYHWFSDADADEYVRKSFVKTRPSLVSFWEDLSSRISSSTEKQVSHASTNRSEIVVDSTDSSAIVLRADLLRYMLMLTEGGVYGDIDTSVLLHIDRWIPEHLGSQIINAVIGIEYDDTTYKMFTRPISFCQWTLMSKPGHSIFDRAVNRVISNLEFLARRQKIQSLSQLKLDKLDILEATGPGMISDVVLEVIKDQLPEQNITWATFHNQREAKLFGDVLVLPINGFAGNQKHSHAGDPMYGEKLVVHHFARSWYRPGKQKVDKDVRLS